MTPRASDGPQPVAEETGLRAGAIQPHGVLLAVTEPGLRVAAVSVNLAEWFGVAPADAVGAELGDVIGTANRVVIDQARTADWVRRCDDVPLLVGYRSLVATLHRAGRYLVIEVEDAGRADLAATSVVREAAMALQHATSVLDVAADAARWIRSLTHFDRVMVHRFDADGNGEVIAEETVPGLEPVLGLRYPAAAVGAPARELYRRNWLQLIPDVGYTPVALVPAVLGGAGDPDGSLDLGMASLRSVSPVHTRFLAAMGVSAALSLSIILQGELWGLVACYQHGGSHRPDVAARNAAEFLAQLTSLRIAEAADAELRSKSAELVAVADHVAEILQSPTVPDLADVLQAREADVLGIARASGAVVVTEGDWIRVGVVPPDAVIAALIDRWPDSAPMLRTDHADLDAAVEAASGVLAFALADDRRDVVMWFRGEHVRHVEWVGDPPPGAVVLDDEPDGRPRTAGPTFHRWRETLWRRSDPWHESEVRAAMRFTRHLTTALMRRERHHAEIASDLQRAMRPASVPALAGWQIDVHDEPAGTGLIGGDWFDVFEVAPGLLVAVVGDVAGHGLRAAAEMAQLRNSLRAYLFDDPSPARALERLDSLMTQVLPGTIATAVCAVIDTATASTRLSHAGHVPSLVGDLAGAAFVPAAEGDALLGVGHGTRREQHLELAPGSALAMYSDGLIEQRRRSIDDGLELLRRTIPKALAQPDGTNLAAWIVEQVHDDRHVDDTSLLVLRRLD